MKAVAEVFELHCPFLPLVLTVAPEEITDLVRVGLHVKRVEVSPRPLSAVLWKAQIPE